MRKELTTFNLAHQPKFEVLSVVSSTTFSSNPISPGCIMLVSTLRIGAFHSNANSTPSFHSMLVLFLHHHHFICQINPQSQSFQTNSCHSLQKTSTVNWSTVWRSNRNIKPGDQIRVFVRKMTSSELWSPFWGSLI